MRPIPIEYALGQYQSTTISLGIKAHRRQDSGNPVLDISQGHSTVTFRLLNLNAGGAQYVPGARRTNHVDFYVLHRDLPSFISALPTPAGRVDGSLRLPPLDPSGTERVGGKQIQKPTPILRFAIEAVGINGGMRDKFFARGDRCQLHVDYEVAPSTLYGREMPELHFGTTAEEWTEQKDRSADDWCELQMSLDCYATLIDELRRL